MGRVGKETEADSWDIFDVESLSSSTHFKEAQAEEEPFKAMVEVELANWDNQVIFPKQSVLLLRYDIRKGLLYRIKQGGWEGQEVPQLLIPHSFRIPLLKLAHENPLWGTPGLAQEQSKIG